MAARDVEALVRRGVVEKARLRLSQLPLLQLRRAAPALLDPRRGARAGKRELRREQDDPHPNYLLQLLVS